MQLTGMKRPANTIHNLLKQCNKLNKNLNKLTFSDSESVKSMDSIKENSVAYQKCRGLNDWNVQFNGTSDVRKFIELSE